VSGVVSGINAGTVNITYSLGGACQSITLVTVNGSASPIGGTKSACIGTMTYLTYPLSGGTWTSSNPSVATINSTGQVTGISLGTSEITYTTGTGCYKTDIVTVNPLPPATTGSPIVCAGSTTALTGTGGTWSSSNVTIATVNSSGIMTGINAGNATITYRYTATGCYVTTVATVNALPVISSAPPALCPGFTATLSATPLGGNWTSTNASIASISTTGLLTGVINSTTSNSSVSINYTIPSTGCVKSTLATVYRIPTAIAGGSRNICVGVSSNLTCSPTGGTWSSSTTSVSTISTLGVVLGLSAGTSRVSYTNSFGCRSTATVTVNTAPGANTGTPRVCKYQTTLLSNSTGTGTWSSSNIATATVNSTGLVTGINSGTARITYNIATGCQSITTVTVNPLLAAITGANSVCIGGSTLFSHVSSGGTWTSSNTGVATVSASGIVTGIAVGTATITYQVGVCFKTKTITVGCSSRPVNENESSTEFNVFPNPTSGTLNIISTTEGKATIYSIDGKMVEQYKVLQGSTDITLPYTLSSGIYLLRFDGNDGSSKITRLVYRQ
jgi:uncharacterized protein YjdB